MNMRYVIRFILILILSFSNFLFSCVNAGAQVSAEFSPVGVLPETGYMYGVTAVSDGRGKKASALSFRKDGGTVYAVVKDDEPGVFFNINVSSIGVYKDFVVIGGRESGDFRKAWIIMVALGDAPQIIDAVKYSSLDSYNYDFYFDLPPASSPGDIEDMDGDGMPETTLDFYERRFRILLEVSENGLHIDYDSPYYLRAFNKLKNSIEKDEYQFREYLLYGVLAGRMSENDGIEKFLGRNSEETVNSPVIISKAVELKKLSVSLGAMDMLAEYFSGGIEASGIVGELNKNGRDGSVFMFALFDFEKELNGLDLDEVVFNDFAAYFSGAVSEEEFRRSAARSLVPYDGDVYSILTNYRELDAALHKAPVLKLRAFTTGSRSGGEQSR